MPPRLVGVDVTITTLEQRDPALLRPGRVLPAGVRIERVGHSSPELVRWLYGMVGGPWHWIDRLAWPRERWAEELDRPGAEVYLLTSEGTPAGYVQLGAAPDDGGGTAAEIVYFGLMEWALGRGLGGGTLTHALRAAWSLADRHDLPAVTRVWLHTCTLDGPHALSNYTARGLQIVGTSTKRERIPAEALGAWTSTTTFDPLAGERGERDAQA